MAVFTIASSRYLSGGIRRLCVCVDGFLGREMPVQIFFGAAILDECDSSRKFRREQGATGLICIRISFATRSVPFRSISILSHVYGLADAEIAMLTALAAPKRTIYSIYTFLPHSSNYFSRAAN